MSHGTRASGAQLADVTRGAAGSDRAPSAERRSEAASASVLSRTFLGEKIEYELECMGELLRSVRYNAGSSDLFGEGETVALRAGDTRRPTNDGGTDQALRHRAAACARHDRPRRAEPGARSARLQRRVCRARGRRCLG